MLAVPVDVDTMPWVTINLEHGDTDHQNCWKLPVWQFETLTAPVNTQGFRGYELHGADVALLAIPDDVEKDWLHLPSSRWLRKKVQRARNLGYEFAPIEHDDYLDDIYAINTSKSERQGKPMTASYRVRPSPIGRSKEQPCPRHRSGYFGVLRDGRLYAYLGARQVGELTATPTLLGHGDYLDDGIMALLLYETAAWHRRVCGSSYVWYYYYYSSGTDGMRFFKEKMGYRPYRVRWELSRRTYVESDGTLRAEPIPPAQQALGPRTD
jgi:hypothetical protein